MPTAPSQIGVGERANLGHFAVTSVDLRTKRRDTVGLYFIAVKFYPLLLVGFSLVDSPSQCISFNIS